MKNFLRALRYCWPYRHRFVFSVLCALLAAALWGLNFTAIYPVLKILGSDQNLQAWAEDHIAQTQRRIDGDPDQQFADGLQPKLEKLLKEEKELDSWPDGSDKEKSDKEKAKAEKAKAIARAQGQLETARTDLYRYQLSKIYLDRYVPADRFLTLAWVIGLVVLAVAIKGVFEFGQESLVGSVVNLGLYDLRNRFYRNAIHLDVDAFNDQGSSEMMSRFTNDMELLAAGKKTLFGKLVAEPLKAIACVLIACWISWQLTLMFLVLVPIAAFILLKVGRVMKRATRRLLERMSSIYKILQESFQGIRVVKAFTMEAYERRRFNAATKDYYQKSMWLVNIDAAAGPVIELLGVLAVAAALLVGAYLVLGGHTHLFGLKMVEQPLESESMLQLYMLLAAIADPVRKLANVYTRVQSGAAAADRIFALADRRPRVKPNSDGPHVGRPATGIEFRDVCFSYNPEVPVLTNINLKVRCGETVAVVGRNGSGKTTLLNLVPRFYDPDHGSILIDGLDLRAANLRSLRRQVGLVTQKTILFDDTVYNNIAYGNPRAKKEDVEKAAEAAFANEFILKLPQGYQTRVGEAGAKLSGGQGQRVALARAILRDPSILILDEFTSQYDPESEALLHKALKEFMRNRTTFVITHRLNTLELADRIVVLEAGRVAGVGTHAELLAGCPAYQRLHEAHSQRLCA